MSTPSLAAAVDGAAAGVSGCRACPRLVAWREEVGRTKRAAHAGETYWSRPVPGMGDPAARLLVLGLAPGAHGANRTGKPFTGDATGAWLFPALEGGGFLRGGGLVDCWVTNAVKCVPPGNRPTAAERDRCAPLLAAEAEALPLQVVLAIGALAWDVALRQRGGPHPKPRFGHGAEVRLDADGAAPARPRPHTVLASYHPSRQNTNTRRLTAAMLEQVVMRARTVLDSHVGTMKEAGGSS